MSDRPTSVSIPLRWKKDGPEDIRLFLGPMHIGDVFLYGGREDKWAARTRALFAHRSDHTTAEAAQIALERALVEAVGNE